MESVHKRALHCSLIIQPFFFTISNRNNILISFPFLPKSFTFQRGKDTQNSFQSSLSFPFTEERFPVGPEYCICK